MTFIAQRFTRLGRTLIAVAVALGAPALARADGHVYHASNPAWKTECASCHIAYPPQLLPAESWRALMGRLDQHFGVDASIDANAAKEISAFLEANAGRRRGDGGASPVLRITETRWFRKEHDEVPARVWESAAVKSPANCEACHTQAASGDFRERTLRVPR